MSRSAYFTFSARRLAVAFGLALVLVPVIAVVAKFVVESTTSYHYEIHWLETVPFLILLFGFVINGELNRRYWPPDASKPG